MSGMIDKEMSKTNNINPLRPERHVLKTKD